MRTFICLVLAAMLVLGGCTLNSTSNSGTQKAESISNTILDEMEGPPKNGHTLERHVGKTEQELRDRIENDHITAASTYYDKQTAVKAVKDSLSINEKKIDDWLQNSKKDRLVIYAHHSFTVGKTVLKADMRVYDHLYDTTTVLTRDTEGGLGFTIITSYPFKK